MWVVEIFPEAIKVTVETGCNEYDLYQHDFGTDVFFIVTKPSIHNTSKTQAPFFPISKMPTIYLQFKTLFKLIFNFT